MKNKIKSIAYSTVSVVFLVAPSTVLAQLNTNPGGNLPSGTVFSIVSNFMTWILALVGIVGVIGFAIAGILYLTAAGDETRIGTAKTAMMYSIIGVIVAIAGVVALQFASGLLGGSSTSY